MFFNLNLKKKKEKKIFKYYCNKFCRFKNIYYLSDLVRDMCVQILIFKRIAKK